MHVNGKSAISDELKSGTTRGVFGGARMTFPVPDALKYMKMHHG